MTDHEQGMVSVDRHVTLPTSPDQAWKSITDASLLSRWMGGIVEIDPRLGGAVSMEPDDGPTVWGTVEDIVDGHRVQWSWRTDDGMPSLIELEIEPGQDDGETLLTVRETLLPWRVSGPDGFTDWPQASVGAIA